MEVNVLSQEKADDLLKSLQGKPNFEKTFLAEMDRKVAGQSLWALPAEDSNPANARTYYLVTSDNIAPYLLVGVNGYLNISSLFLVSENRIKCMAAQCFKYLLKKELLPRCTGRACIYATAGTEEGVRFFQKLAYDLPDGVMRISGTERIIIELK